MSKSERLRIGIHLSIAGGLPKDIESAVAKGCDGLQIFARNPRGWTARVLELNEVCAFREAREWQELTASGSGSEGVSRRS